VADIDHSAVLAPTHLLTSEPAEWLAVDIALTIELRRALNELDLVHVPIYYPLIARSEQFYDAQWRGEVAQHLVQVPIDALWLGIHPFGTPKAGPLVLKITWRRAASSTPSTFPWSASTPGRSVLP